MYKLIFLLSLLFLGCEEKKEVDLSKYDAPKLLKQKCSACHVLSIPAVGKDDEKAPPMMAVVFHLKDYMRQNTDEETKSKFIEFVNDYVFYPSKEKSYCDKKSLEEYGVMPSQKGNLTQNELNAIAHYIYDKYDNKKFYKEQMEKQRLARLPLHKRVIEKYRCNNCHDTTKDKIAPSFTKISKKYSKNDANILVNSIKNGSKGKYKDSKIPMPPFKKIKDEEALGIAKWILSLKK